jgi:hypothetical protein
MLSRAGFVSLNFACCAALVGGLPRESEPSPINTNLRHGASTAGSTLVPWARRRLVGRPPCVDDPWWRDERFNKSCGKYHQRFLSSEWTDKELAIECKNDRNKAGQLAADSCLFSCNAQLFGKCARLEDCFDDSLWVSKRGQLRCSHYGVGHRGHRFCGLETDANGVLASEACPAACHTCPDGLLDLDNPPFWNTALLVVLALAPFTIRAVEIAATLRHVVFSKGSQRDYGCCCCCPARLQTYLDTICCSRRPGFKSVPDSDQQPPADTASTVHTEELGEQQSSRAVSFGLDVDSVWHSHNCSESTRIIAAGGMRGLAIRRLLTWHIAPAAVYLYLLLRVYFEALDNGDLNVLLFLAYTVAIREVGHVAAALVCCVKNPLFLVVDLEKTIDVSRLSCIGVCALAPWAFTLRSLVGHSTPYVPTPFRLPSALQSLCQCCHATAQA